MKLRMAENSLFAILLRSPWWISVAIALVLATAAVALLPAAYRVVGAISGAPFVCIAVMVAMRQRHMPKASHVIQTRAALAALSWTDFASMLSEALTQDGYRVKPGTTAGVDFVLERGDRRQLVSARRWKSARVGIELLRTLQVASAADQPSAGLCICLGELTDGARRFAATNRISIWQATELARILPLAGGSRSPRR